MPRKTSKLQSLSIFFPAYNEAGNIEEAIYQALHVAPMVAKKYEVIVINDGSKDSTKAIAERVAKRNKHVRVVNQRNKGYGGAVKRGLKEAKYEWVFFTDSDLQFDMAELLSFIPYAGTNDMVLGYRKNRAEGWKRAMLAKALKLWNRVFLSFPVQIKDIDCAFKLIHKSVLKEVLPLYSDGAMVSTEMLLKAHKKGFRYTQIGVTHYLRRVGKPTGSNFKVITKAIKDTFALQQQLIIHSPVAAKFRVATNSVLHLLA